MKENHYLTILFSKILMVFSILCLSNVLLAQTQMWGVTPNGGDFGKGAIFKMNGDGTERTEVHSFRKYDGAGPNGVLTIGNDGKLYGTTFQGGSSADALSSTTGAGTVFSFDPSTGEYKIIRLFSIHNTTTTGRVPIGGLVTSGTSPQRFYGVARSGGANNRGIIFSDKEGAVAAPHYNFADATGGLPTGSMIKVGGASCPVFYGFTELGGENSTGVIFRFKTCGGYEKLADFTDSITGKKPQGKLLFSDAGSPGVNKLYGVTLQGGIQNRGVLFRYDFALDTLIALKHFENALGVINPRGGLIEASDGLFYGIASGGSGSSGILYAYDPVADSVIIRHKFFASPTNLRELGYSPDGELLQAADGKLYGYADAGGANNMGVIFSYDLTDSIYTKLVNFSGEENGSNPGGSLVQAADGQLWGTTFSGGVKNKGVLFSFDTATSTLTKHIDFSVGDGEKPIGKLLSSNNGKLYGTTNAGGEFTNRSGTIFSFDTATYEFNVLHNFKPNQIKSVVSGLTDGGNGRYYVMGAQPGDGRIVSFDTTAFEFRYEHAFNGGDGDFGSSSLLKATDGLIYGTAVSGGISNGGTLFSLDPKTADFSVKVKFNNTTVVKRPYAGLIQVTDSLLYGVGQTGGANNQGAVFSYNIYTEVVSQLASFDLSQYGRNPDAQLLKASNGKLYGIADGSNRDFYIYSYDIGQDTLGLEYHVNQDSLGYKYLGGLQEGTNGKLYGITGRGGANSRGVLYAYDPVSKTYEVIHHRVNGFEFNASAHSQITLTDPPVNTWNGSLWSKTFPPIATEDARIEENYSLAMDGSLAAAKLEIPAGDTVFIEEGESLRVTKDLANEGNVQVASGASLLLGGSVSGAGSTTIKKNLTGNFAYNTLGTPLKAPFQNVGSFDPVPDIAYAHSEINGFTSLVNPSFSDVRPGRGFFISYEADKPTITFNGTPNYDSMIVSVEVDNDSFNLVANPYAAAIDRKQFMDANLANLDGAIWIWDDGGANVGGLRGGDYIAINDLGQTSQGGGDGVPGIGGLDKFNGNISSMQGFFVRALSESGIVFRPDMQVVGANADSSFFRRGNHHENLIRLSISNKAGLYNEVLVGLRENATYGKDRGLDAEKLSGNDMISLYTQTGQSKYSIQGLPFVSANEIVTTDLGFYIGESGKYEVKVENYGDFNDGAVVHLIDKYEGKIYDLSEVSSIPVTLDKKGDFQRFSLVFSAKESNLLTLSDDLNKSISIMANEDGSLTVLSDFLRMTDINITSLQGKHVYGSTVSFEGGASVINPTLDKGQVYVLQVASHSLKFILK